MSIGPACGDSSNIKTPRSNGTSSQPKLLACIAFCLSMGVISGATTALPPAMSPPLAPEPMAFASDAVDDPGRTSFDEPMRLVRRARAAFATVDDYTCTLIKRERLDAKSPLADSVIAMSVLNKPFSVHLRWQKPNDVFGQEVCYVEGKNNGKMRRAQPACWEQ